MNQPTTSLSLLVERHDGTAPPSGDMARVVAGSRAVAGEEGALVVGGGEQLCGGAVAPLQPGELAETR